MPSVRQSTGPPNCLAESSEALLNGTLICPLLTHDKPHYGYIFALQLCVTSLGVRPPYRGTKSTKKNSTHSVPFTRLRQHSPLGALKVVRYTLFSADRLPIPLVGFANLAHMGS